jgi:uncharacterized protein involved in copper resistance
MSADLGFRPGEDEVSYASAKGKTAHIAAEERRPPPELSDEQKAAIAERARLVKQHIPEMMDFVRALHAEGMVDGLRCIESVTVFEEVDHGVDG